MARGFWTGLGHGAVLSAAGLALLSLLLPLPSAVDETSTQVEETAPLVDTDTNEVPLSDATADEVEQDPDQQATPSAPDSVAADPAMAAAGSQTASDTSDAAVGGGDQANDDQAAQTQPDAAAVDLPVGSEFGRGGDVTPRLPDPLTPPGGRMDLSDAPAVSAPAAEPAPVAITDTGERPDTLDAASDPGQSAPEAGGDAPDLARPGALEAPSVAKAPSFGQADRPDTAPSPAAPAEAPEDTDGATSVDADDAPVDTRPGDATPTADADDPVESSQVSAETVGETDTPDDSSDPAPAAADPAPPAVTVEQNLVEAPETEVAEPSDPAIAPGLPAPALDLSLPPDLSDLRLLERD